MRIRRGHFGLLGVAFLLIAVLRLIHMYGFRL